MFKDNFNKKDYDHSVIPIIGFSVQYVISMLLAFAGIFIFPYSRIFINYDTTLGILDIVFSVILQIYSSAVLISFILELVIIRPIVSHFLKKENITLEKFDFGGYFRLFILFCLLLMIIHGYL